MIVKGHHVAFACKNGKVLVPPPDWVLLHDEVGDVHRPCDLLVAPYKVISEGRSSSDKLKAEKLDAYYGRDIQDWLKILVDVPQRGWKRRGDVTAIFYSRDGEHAGHYEHQFSAPQRLEECSSPGCLRISLPDGCVWNWRGIVYP